MAYIQDWVGTKRPENKFGAPKASEALFGEHIRYIKIEGDRIEPGGSLAPWSGAMGEEKKLTGGLFPSTISAVSIAVGWSS